MKNKFVRLILLIVAVLGISYIAYFGVGEDKTGSGEAIRLGLDLNGGLSITFETVVDNPSQQDMDDTKEKLETRVYKYSTEASVYQEGGNRINVEIPLKNTTMEAAKEILDDLGTPGKLEFKTYDGEVIITGAHITNANVLTDESGTGAVKYMVGLDLNKEGAELFAKATKEAAQQASTGKNIINIYYDDVLISSPYCNKEITGGKVQIDNMGSYDEASKLATYIRIGAIPLELNTLRSNIVAPQLGSDAIKSSLTAAAIGVMLIILFMCFVYRVPGFASSLALIIYVGLVIFSISVLELTLTLPGIAGIVLSIGMAVDANVIIFERIREELGAGNSVEGAISAGFDKAFGAIFDGNITTLIAAAVLFALGSGTIKGFAATLAVGIILSMFTALVITKFILKLFYDLGIKNKKLYGVQKERKSIDFVGKKKIFALISIVLILVGPISMLINNSNGKGILNFGIEFAGGSSISVTFNENMSQDELEQKVVPIIRETLKTNEVQVQRVEGSNEVIFKLREITDEEGVLISDALVKAYNVDASKVNADTISSTISGEMKKSAILAIGVATVAMLIYIWIRFSNIRFATSAIIAILHDVLVVLAFYAVSRISVGNTFIACMLTIVGYTINATIVIFDRIRENLKNQGKKETLDDVVNKSVTETLSRSINTSLTTFVTVFMLYLLGVTSIKDFALPIMVGVVCGAYSSVCITGALWHTFMKRFPVKEED